MTASDRRGDPLDLPIFGSPAVAPDAAGRLRSSFEFDPDTAVTDTATHPAQPPSPRSTPVLTNPATLVRSGPETVGVDWQLVARMRAEVARRLADQMGDARWSAADQESEGWAIIRRLLEEQAADALAESAQPRGLAEQEILGKAVFDALFALGRLQPLIDNDQIENILISGCDKVIVEYADGTLERMSPVADSDEELAEFLAFLAARAENPRSFTMSQPSLHLTLPDGSRLAAARDTAGISVVIRRHRVRQVTLNDLVTWGTLSPTMASFLRAAVRARLSIVISGAQGAGKTTLLRALCAEIDPWEVLGTFESEYELFLHELPQHHMVFAWESREGSGEWGPSGKLAGSRCMAEQIIDIFRFRLDRQIVGEVRGSEVWSVVKLMESGSGSISTTHAANAHRAISKLITCAMEAQVGHELAAAKLGETIDLVVHLACIVVPGGRHGAPRKHRYVEEILHVSPGEQPRGYATNTVFAPVSAHCAVARTRPDELMGRLVESGFDAALFEAELAGAAA